MRIAIEIDGCENEIGMSLVEVNRACRLLFQEKAGSEKCVKDVASYVVDERTLFSEKEVVVSEVRISWKSSRA